jgi:hypothetical protein
MFDHGKKANERSRIRRLSVDYSIIVLSSEIVRVDSSDPATRDAATRYVAYACKTLVTVATFRNTGLRIGKKKL